MADLSTQEKTDWIPALAATTTVVLVTMDLFMMPVAKTALSSGLGIKANQVQSAISTFAIIYAGLCILGGRLGDIMGKRKIHVIGLSLYALAALITAFAPNFDVLVLGFSVVRGLAVPLAVPASVALIVASYRSSAQRGIAFSIYGLGAGLAGLSGPVLMGFMADKVTWRIPFGIDAAIAVIGILLTLRLRETERRKEKLDGPGTALTFVAIASMILAGMLGATYGWWDARRPFELWGVTVNPLDLSPVVPLYAAAMIFAALAVGHVDRVEERGASPLFSLRLFDSRAFSATAVVVVLFWLLVGALPFIVPIFLQDGVGFDGAKTGMVMTAFMTGSIVAGLASGRLVTAMQPRFLLQLCMILAAAGMLGLVAVSSLSMTPTVAILPMIVVGLAFGVVTTQVSNLLVSPLSPELQGSGSGFAEMAKALGVGLGTAVIGSILFSAALGGMVDKVAMEAGEQITLEERAELILQVEDESLPEEVERIVAERVPALEALTREAYVDAFQVTLGVLIAMVLLAFFIASFIPRIDAERFSPGGGS
jgi:MFS family permease